MSKKVLVLMADGFEDVEAVTPIDFLRRAGAEVVVAGVGGALRTGARGVRVQTDKTVAEAAKEAWDAVVVPGGMPGASNIAASADCAKLIKAAADSGKLVAAICAAPAVVLYPLGLLGGRRFTCYPGMEKDVSGARWSQDRVVADGNLLTSRGPGTAAEWALEIVSKLFGADAAKKIADATLVSR